MNLGDWTSAVLQKGLPAELDQVVSGFLGKDGTPATVPVTASDTKPAQIVVSNAAPASAVGGPATIPQGTPGQAQTASAAQHNQIMIYVGFGALALLAFYLLKK